MQPKSQFSSGNLAHKASAPKSPATQFGELNCSAQAMQPCSPGASSAQAFNPRSLISSVFKSSAAQLRPNSPGASSTQAFSPRSLSSIVLNSSTLALDSGHADEKSIRFMQNSAKNTSRGESDEIKNGYSLNRRLHMSWVPSPTKKTTRSNQRYVREIRHQRKEQKVKKGSGPQWGCLVPQNSLLRGTLLPPRR